MADGDRDRKMEEAMGAPVAGAGAGAFEGRDSSKRHEAAMVNLVGSLAIADDDRGLKTKEAKPWEVEGGILKIKKEMSEAMYQWRLAIPSSRMMLEEEEAKRKAQEAPEAGAAKKKVKKVKKVDMPKELVDFMFARHPKNSGHVSDEVIASYRPIFRAAYMADKVLHAKTHAYWKALHDQQEETGHAQDEVEVTDDDEEEEVVKN